MDIVTLLLPTLVVTLIGCARLIRKDFLNLNKLMKAEAGFEMLNA